MQAVILAAGDGGRLYPLTSSTPKPLLQLGGRAIIEHVLDALQHAGVDDVVVVLGYRGDQIRRALAGRDSCGMHVRFVENDGFLLGNARSIWAARHAVDGSFVLAMGDHLIEPELASALVEEANGRCRLAVEHTHRADARADEATRACVRDGRVVDLGKEIADWNALDTGIFWCTPRVFDAMTPAMRDGEAGAVFAKLARAGELDAVDVSGSRWMDIDTPEDLRLAEASLASGALWHNEHARSA
ncbi:MAG TPA: sugar phosphate nucleotidyltransferase [Dehalococcoidia bacterium]|jgi:NDP-sugar pyrophosphorylase family protein|nr:sugar phosphate nucleotidyltransferase [Dehalococcoidia bacterium]